LFASDWGGYDVASLREEFIMTRFRQIAVVCLGLFAISVGRAADAPATQPATDQQRMESWWDDLKDEEPNASRALLNFSSKPEQTIVFFKDRVVPLKIAADDVAVLITSLGNDKESVWKPAFEQLEYFDPRLCIDLPTLMQDSKETIARIRLVEVLSDVPPGTFKDKDIQLRSAPNGSFNFTGDRGSWWAEPQISRLARRKWTRATRAISLLAHIGTPEAMAIIRDMASGHPDAQPTKVAKEMLASPGK
jgi:hypothetical protein